MFMSLFPFLCRPAKRVGVDGRPSYAVRVMSLRDRATIEWAMQRAWFRYKFTMWRWT